MQLRLIGILLSLSSAPIAMPADAVASPHQVHLQEQAHLDPNATATSINIPHDSQITASKVFTFDHWTVAHGGETAFTIDNMHLTLYHIKGPGGVFSTQAVVDLHLTNTTENNKGNHDAHVNLFLKGSLGNILVPTPITVWIQRDTCQPGNPVTAGPQMLAFDIFDQTTSATAEAFMKWDYEGKC